MKSERRNASWRWVVGVAAIAALLILGSWFYWRADGSVGTPDDFRRHVAESGLDVAWSNSGPRSGSGVIETSCGALEVTIEDTKGDLWIRWDGKREPVDGELVDALLSCEGW